jgi:hypothetical protein
MIISVVKEVSNLIGEQTNAFGTQQSVRLNSLSRILNYKNFQTLSGMHSGEVSKFTDFLQRRKQTSLQDRSKIKKLIDDEIKFSISFFKLLLNELDDKNRQIIDYIDPKLKTQIRLWQLQHLISYISGILTETAPQEVEHEELTEIHNALTAVEKTVKSFCSTEELYNYPARGFHFALITFDKILNQEIDYLHHRGEILSYFISDLMFDDSAIIRNDLLTPLSKLLSLRGCPTTN